MRICASGLEQANLDHILWKHPRPLLTPYLCDGDIAGLYNLQKGSFAPASTLCIEASRGHLMGIRVYCQAGSRASINGIQFVYDSGPAAIWGCSDDAVSLALFLDKEEHIVEVTVFKVGSVVYHVQVSWYADHREGDLC